jgi:hypothetical protein
MSKILYIMLQPNSNFTEDQIIKRLDEFFESGYSIPDYCYLCDGLDEATLIDWIKKYRPESHLKKSEGFLTVELIQDDPVASTTSNANRLFAEVGKIKLYRPVPATYLKSLQP